VYGRGQPAITRKLLNRAQPTATAISLTKRHLVRQKAQLSQTGRSRSMSL